MKLVKNILTNSSCYNAGYQIKPIGIVLHSVGCAQPRASVFLKNFNKPGMDVCPHAFIDGLTSVVYETLPWNWRGWHVGGAANNTHIGIEMCEPDCISYYNGDRIKCSDFARAKEIANRTYKSAVELFAFLCKTYGFDPLKDGVILSHNECGKRGLGSRHSDPEHLWTQLGMDLTMNGFREDVKAAMTEPQPAPDGIIYRVQIGAFTNRDNAERQAADARAKGFKNAFVAVAGDMDGDGKLTAADSREILKKSVGLE